MKKRAIFGQVCIAVYDKSKWILSAVFVLAMMVNLNAMPRFTIRGDVLTAVEMHGETEAVIPDGVIAIMDFAFRDCYTLTSLTIPESVRSIGGAAFSGCSNLASITFLGDKPFVSSDTFEYVSANCVVRLPRNNTTYGNRVDGSRWYGMTVELYGPVVANWTIDDGVLTHVELNGLTEVAIPDSVTSIGDFAFQNCSGLTSVTIPPSVTSIGDYAFSDCWGLTSVTIPSSVTSVGRGAFSFTKLWDDHLNGLVIIDNCLIGYEGVCSGAMKIPGGVRVIADSAFEYCSWLTSVTIPSGVTSIGKRAFYGCSGLMSFVVDAENPNYSSPNGLLCSKDGKTLIAGVNGNVTIPSSMTSIGDLAFEGCSGLTSVTIPSCVASIGKWAFYGCSGLMSFVVDKANPNYSSPNGLLCSKDGKTLISGVNGNVTIPSSVTSIGDSTFSGCRGLTSVMIPSSVTSIGDDAFSSCAGLTSVTIPSSVTSIGVGAFDGCSGLKSVTIPSSVTSIGSYAFYGCRRLTSVTIPSSVTGIGDWAFYGCNGLTSVTIPSGVTSVGSYAFRGCSGLTSVTIPSSVTSIGDYAFYYCYELATVYVSKGDAEHVRALYSWPSNVAFVEIVFPVIEGDEGATVTGDAETGFVIRPSEGKTVVEVSIPDGIDAGRVTVEVSPKVESVKPHGAKVKVVSGGADITEFLNMPAADGSGVIDLTQATVKDEVVKDVLDTKKGAVVELNAANPTIETAPTKPGLVYTFRESTTLEGLGELKPSATKVGDGQPWSPKITVKGGSAAFYSIGVGKGE